MQQYLPESDISRLKEAYRNYETEVVLSDGRCITHREPLRHNSCSGCVFAHTVGCYCQDGEIWTEKQV